MAMPRSVITVASGLGILLNSAVFAATHDEQAAACRSDALRHCAVHIPNEEKITACMKAHLRKLSPKCRAMFEQPAPSNQQEGDQAGTNKEQ
jgi:hypothetical protein